ncbi:MAG: hypothetical protein C6Y20_02305 [Tagaea sp. CACIAM 22H2]|nr:hypothetical protein [Tagaea sp. CACIAM 22H2]
MELENFGSTAFVTIRKARSFNEIEVAKKSAARELGDQIKKGVEQAFARHGVILKSAPGATSRTEPLPVQRIERERTASDIYVEITTKVQAMRKDGETLTMAWDRAMNDPKVNELYVGYLAARTREGDNGGVSKSLAMAREQTRERAKAERLSIEQEIERQAVELRARYPMMTMEAARSKIIEADKALYTQWTLAAMREKDPGIQGV